MMLGARTAAWYKSGDGVPTARNYVQSGLVAMWDGIENAGWGVHNPNATEWKDLINGNDATLQTALSDGRYWRDNCFYNTLESAMFIGAPTSSLKTALTAGDFTIQGVFVPEIQPSTGNFCAFQCSPADITTDGCIFSMVNMSSCGSANKMTWAGTRATITLPREMKTLNALLGTSFNPTFVFDFVNGTQKTMLWNLSATISTTDAVPTASDLTSFAIGCYNWNAGRSRAILGELYNFRIYSRALTADEVARNYAIDKSRFNLT